MKRYSLQEDQFVNDNFKELSRKELAVELGRTPLSVKSVLKRLGLKNTSDEILAKQIKFNRKQSGEFTVNEKLFTTDIDETASYLLGLLWADGYVRIKRDGINIKNCRIVLSLKKNDGEYIKNILEKTGKWSFYISNVEKNTQYQFHCANTILCEFLEKNDYKEKSYKSPEKILNIIPRQHHSHFFRGYLDGDGCIFVKKNAFRIIFTSTIIQDWNFLKSLCKKLGCKFSISRVVRKYINSKYSSFSLFGKRNCLLFGGFIYCNSTIAFPRKKEKYNLIVNYRSLRQNYD